MADPMNTSTVERALRRLGEVVEYHREIEILLVGGAAGMDWRSGPQPRDHRL